QTRQTGGWQCDVRGHRGTAPRAAAGSGRMSGANRKPAGSANLPARYDVGYAKPPAEHRFRKGQSGNPGGRPKGAVNKPKIDTSYGQMPTAQYLREEAYRTVV